MHQLKRHPSFDMSHRSLWLWFFLIFICALAYRSIYYPSVRNHPLFVQPVIDASQHHATAQRISQGYLWGKGPDDVFKPPLYPLLLGGIYYIFGPRIKIAQILQLILGSICAVLTALIGLLLFDKKTGIIAGLIYAFYAPFVFFEGQLLTPTISILLNLLISIILITICYKKDLSWLLLGLLSGLAVGVRPDVLLPLILILGYFLIQFFEDVGITKSLIRIALLITGFLIIALPITLRNHALTNDWIFISSNAGINFYTGNSSAADGVSAIPPGLAWEKVISTVPRETLIRPAQASRFWFSRTLSSISKAPFTWMTLLCKKGFAYFNGLEFRNNIGYNWFRASIPLLNAPFIQYWPVAALGILGIFLLLFHVEVPSQRHANLPILWILGYLWVGMIFFVNARFRLPAVPFFIILAAAGALWLFQKARSGPRGVFSAILISLLLLVITWPGWFSPSKGSNHLDFINEGNVFRSLGKMEKAFDSYEKAYKLNPEGPEGWFLGGYTAYQLGRTDKATDLLQRALILSKEGVDIRLNLGNIYLGQGKWEKAQEEFQSILSLAEEINLWHKRVSLAKARLGLYETYKIMGMKKRALAELEKAWNMDERTVAEYCFISRIEIERVVSVFKRFAEEEPWNWYPQANLGMAFLRLGEYKKAEVSFKRALDSNNVPPGVNLNLAIALVKCGKKQEAQRLINNLLERLPRGPIRDRAIKILQDIDQNHGGKI
ncbi:MAG: tetratricopeptide repeat protein [bacterium]